VGNDGVAHVQCGAVDDLDAGDNGMASSETMATLVPATMAIMMVAIAVTTVTTLTLPLRGAPHATPTTTTM